MHYLRISLVFILLFSQSFTAWALSPQTTVLGATEGSPLGEKYKEKVFEFWWGDKEEDKMVVRLVEHLGFYYLDMDASREANFKRLFEELENVLSFQKLALTQAVEIGEPQRLIEEGTTYRSQILPRSNTSPIEVFGQLVSKGVFQPVDRLFFEGRVKRQVGRFFEKILPYGLLRFFNFLPLTIGLCHFANAQDGPISFIETDPVPQSITASPLTASYVKTAPYAGGDMKISFLSPKTTDDMYQTHESGYLIKFQKGGASSGWNAVGFPLRSLDLNDYQLEFDLEAVERSVNLKGGLFLKSHSIKSKDDASLQGTFLLEKGKTTTVVVAKEALNNFSSQWIQMVGQSGQMLAGQVNFYADNMDDFGVGEEVFAVKDVRIITRDSSILLRPEEQAFALRASFDQYFKEVIPLGGQAEWSVYTNSILSSQFSDVSFLFDMALGVQMLLGEQSDTSLYEAGQIIRTVLQHFPKKDGASELLTSLHSTTGSPFEWVIDNGARAHLAIALLRFVEEVGKDHSLAADCIELAEAIWLDIYTQYKAPVSGAFYPRSEKKEAGWETMIKVLGEHEVDFYALTKLLSRVTQKSEYEAHNEEIFNFIKDYAFHPDGYIYQSMNVLGPGNVTVRRPTASDINSWAVLAMGVETLDQLSGRDHTAYDMLIHQDNQFRSTIQGVTLLSLTSDNKAVTSTEFTLYFIQALDLVADHYSKMEGSDAASRFETLKSLRDFYFKEVNKTIMEGPQGLFLPQSMIKWEEAELYGEATAMVESIGPRVDRPSAAPVFAWLLAEKEYNLFDGAMDLGSGSTSTKEVKLNQVARKGIQADIHYQAGAVEMSFDVPSGYDLAIKNIQLIDMRGRVVANKKATEYLVPGKNNVSIPFSSAATQPIVVLVEFTQKGRSIRAAGRFIFTKNYGTRIEINFFDTLPLVIRRGVPASRCA